MGVGYKRRLTREESSIMKISCQISCDVVLSSPRLFSTNIACTGMQCNAALFQSWQGQPMAPPSSCLQPWAKQYPMWGCDTLDSVWTRIGSNWGNKPLGIPSIIRSQMPAPYHFWHHWTWELLDWKDWWAWQPNQLVWHLHLGAKRTKKNQSASSHACRKLAVGILNRTEPMVNTILRHGQFEICLSSSSSLGLCPAPESRRAAAPKGSSWAFNRMLEIQKSVCVLLSKYVWIPVPFSQTTACKCETVCWCIYLPIYLPPLSHHQ